MMPFAIGQLFKRTSVRRCSVSVVGSAVSSSYFTVVLGVSVNYLVNELRPGKLKDGILAMMGPCDV